MGRKRNVAKVKVKKIVKKSITVFRVRRNVCVAFMVSFSSVRRINGLNSSQNSGNWLDFLTWIKLPLLKRSKRKLRVSKLNILCLSATHKAIGHIDFIIFINVYVNFYYSS